MKRLIATLCVGLILLVALGFAFIAVTDVPVVQQDIVKSLPAPSTSP